MLLKLHSYIAPWTMPSCTITCVRCPQTYNNMCHSYCHWRLRKLLERQAATDCHSSVLTRLTMTALKSQPITLREPLTLRGGGGRIVRGPRPTLTRLTMTALNSQPITLREPLTLRGGGGRIVRGPRPTVTRLTMTALNSQPITLREPLTLRGGERIIGDHDRLSLDSPWRLWTASPSHCESH